jgi:hypothetical protein
VADVPEVLVARVDLGARRRHLDAALVRVVERILATADVPVAPRRDHFEIRSKRLVSEFETHLVVALAGATVRHGVGADGLGVFDLALGQDRARHAGAEQVAALVDRHRPQAWPHVVREPLAPQVFDLAGHRTALLRLLFESAQFLIALADVAAVAMHLAVVVLLQPGDDDGGVEAAGVGEDDLLLAHGGRVGSVRRGLHKYAFAWHTYASGGRG